MMYKPEVVQCANGHYFDRNLGNCPQCQQPPAMQAQKNAKKSLFGFSFGKSTPTPHIQPPVAPVQPPKRGISGNMDSRTVLMPEIPDEPAYIPPQEKADEPMQSVKAVRIIDHKAAEPDLSGGAVYSMQDKRTDQNEQEIQEEPGKESVTLSISSSFLKKNELANERENRTEPSEVKDEIKPIQIERQPKVVTLSYYGETDPVVGWLVCVRGQYKGQSFVLNAGRNSIGRDPDRDICLANEPGVSRHHGAVLFDPKNCVFLIIPDESRSLTYIGDTLITQEAHLTAYDRLFLGKECELCFVPLCCDRFSWNELE